MAPPRSSRQRVCAPLPSNRGFALLITVTLLAFLVLLLVSLATLTRVETQVASNGQNLAQARQTALMALNIALGQLQKYAGPDQRVTTTADLVATKDKAGATAPAPVFSSDTSRLVVQPGARYWTGVWGNRQSTIQYDLTPDNIPSSPGTTNKRGVTPGLLNWLVSGNEGTAFTANGSSGGVNAGTGITYSPDLTVNLADTNNPTINNQPAVVLVGANSVGSAASSQQDYVTAPLVNIQAPAGSASGLDATATPVIGRYAWWVGDEGVKARINLQNGYQQTGLTSDRVNSFITAQRSAVEFMDRDPTGTSNPAQIGTDFDFNATTVPGILAEKQLPVVNSDTTAQTRLALASRYRFHDITTRSYGVLSDTYAGGLKKDLTADLADTSSDYSYRPANTDTVFTPISSGEKYLPTWAQLRNWARTNPDSTGLIDPTNAESKSASIQPIVLFVGMGMNYILGDMESGGRRLKMAFYPMVVLYNPYPWPIKATDYDVGIRFANYSGGTSTHNTFQIRTKKATDTTYVNQGYVDLNSVAIYLAAPPPSGLQNSFIRLRISSKNKSGTAVDIPPGQRFSYMLTTTAVAEYDHNNPPELRRVDAVTDESTNYFTLTSAPLPGVLDDPTYNIQLFGNDGSSNNSGTYTTSLKYMEASVALADSGGLSDKVWANNFPRFRSSVLNVFPVLNGGVGYRQFCQLESDPDPETIGDRIIPESPKAKTCFRMVAINEARFNWSTLYRGGFPHPQPMARYIADANLRAPYVAKPAMENDPATTDLGNVGIRFSAPPFGVMLQGGRADGYSLAPFPGIDLTFSHYGFGFQHPAGAVNERAILFDVLKSPASLLSLGQLQHVPWARYSFNTSYPFANSYAPLRTPRSRTYRTSGVRRADDLTTNGAITAATDSLYDLSWLLNRSLWDKYFVSGVPGSLASTATTLPDARMTVYTTGTTTPSLDNLRYPGTGTNKAYDQAAANLLVKGAFNINSTSEQAWRAVLAGSKGLPTDSSYAETADSAATAIPYPRFSRNITALATLDGPYEALATTMKLPTTAGNATPTETDIRRLMQTTNRGLYLNNPSLAGNPSAQAVVTELARSIVNEIRTRGPFLSLSDFINRPLTDTAEGLKGTLQAGLDNMDPAVAQVNPDYLATKLTSVISPLSATSYQVTAYQWDPEAYIGRTSTGRGQISSTRWAMSPLQLTQADLLSSLGPMLSARSDTFTIRTYGETTNPATGAVVGRAWCEAVVQRLPDYTGGEAAETAPASLTTSTSRTFGRKFKVVSFRWLAPSDI